MAAATITDGPDGTGYLGHWFLGEFSANTQMGLAAFPTTDLTCTIACKGGGLLGAPLAFVQHSVVDKTVIAAYDANTGLVTFTRTESSSAATFCYLFVFLK